MKSAKSELFHDIYGDRELRSSCGSTSEGKKARDDFGKHTGGRLVVSKRALDVLKTAQLDHCAIEEFF